MANELFDDEPKAAAKPARAAGKGAKKAETVAPVAGPVAATAIPAGGTVVTMEAPFEDEPEEGLNGLSAASSTEPGGAAPLMAAPTSPANYAAPPLPERIVEERTGEATPGIFAGEGLTFPRYFTKEGVDVYDTVAWEERSAAIKDEKGNVVFEQKDCEIPAPWSMLATNVVVSKYFRGKVGTPGREKSVKQLVSRVADTVYDWGKKGGYFATDADADTFHDELKYLLLHQYMAFNSPVWFNLGVPGERPQVSACQPYDAPVSTPQGLIPIGCLVEENAVGTPVYDAHGVTRIVATKANGKKEVLRLHTKAGYALDVTADHLVWKMDADAPDICLERGDFVEAGTLTVGDRLTYHETIEDEDAAVFGVKFGGYDFFRASESQEVVRIESLGEMEVYDIQTESGEYLSGNVRVHNCFINSVDDTMESILTLAKTEGMLFKWGSGTGTNISVLRSSKEGLKGGGTASGPVSFMRGFDAFAGAIKCLTPDAYVYTDKGLETLGQLISPDLAPGFHEDDSVTLATKDEPTRISHVYVSPKAETFRLRLKYTSLNLRGTAEHPVLTLTPDFRLEWKRLAHVQAGDRVAVSRRTELWPAAAPTFADFAPVQRYSKKKLIYPTEMTPELARLLGYMVSEGTMDDERFRFSNADADVFADFLHCVRAVFGTEATSGIGQRVHPTTGIVTHTFEAYWTNAVRFLKHVGLTTANSADKTLPSSVRRSPRALVAEFLRAYFEGDGHVSRDVYAASASERLLQEIQLLLLNMGMVSLLRPHPVNGKQYWSLYLRGEQAWQFVREVGFVSERKRAAAERIGDKNANTNIDTLPFLADVLRTRTDGNGYFRCSDGVKRFVGFGFFNRRPGAAISYNRLRTTPNLADKVRVIEPEWADTLDAILKKEFFWDEAQPVTQEEEAVTYDFTVPGTHSFIANGIVNHNSGGKTRRAAKMTILNADHPDIEEFIECKADAERKAHALIEAGYSGAFNVANGAYDSVFFQNANHSVRGTDEFMKAVENDADWTTYEVTTGQPSVTYKARDLMAKISAAAWVCGDPGMQFDSTANRWHTCPNSGRINASNPCCFTGDTLVAVADGRNAVPFCELAGQTVPVYTWDHQAKRTVIAEMHNIGVKRQGAKVFKVTLDDGSTFRATDDHLIMLRDGSYRQVKDLKRGDSLNPFHSQVRQPQDTRSKRRYVHTGAGWKAQYRWIWEAANGPQPDGFHIHHRDFNSLNDALVNLGLLPEAEHMALHRDGMLGDNNPARRLMTDAWRANISRAVSGEGNPNFGKTHGEETRAKMREASAGRWGDQEQRENASHAAKNRVAKARAEGKRWGRTPGERFERACPCCRKNFVTAREEQIFCSAECRYSRLGLDMIGAKGGATKQGRPLTEAHKESLRASSIAAAKPEDKGRAAEESLRARCLKAARLLTDARHEISLDDWNDLRNTARQLGAAYVPQTESLARFFVSDAELREATALYNHKVVSVEFDGEEDVYDGTVEGHHNFAIVTSAAAGVGGEKAPDYSGVFVHNSEYFFLDDTACNLASLNLMKFRLPNREFDIEAFQSAVRVTITAMEILVGNAAYPTDKITVNSFDYRPLGLGYANLGALLMARGLAYDSDAGRAYAAAITSILSGTAYHQSAKAAGRVGPFAGYDKNRQPMLRVMQMHRDHVDKIHAAETVPVDMVDVAKSCWDDAIELGGINGYRNSQISVLAPTGTIGFLMDCDTTGVEPDIAIVKYKSLVGGGMFKIVNQTVPEALERLGYSASERKAILDYIDANDTIEGAPGLSDDHLPVFDCAFRARNGVRSIHYMGHIKMMSAVQPFLSGAISKTVNMPNEATPDEIAEAYLQAWRLGVKALAIYRDGSKKTQPLSTGKADDKPVETPKEAVKEAPVPVAAAVESRPLRRKLPDERQSLTHKFSVGGHEGYLTVGMYPEGKPGEIFITMSKEGSVVSGLMDAFATSISLALQYGVPLKTLVDKFMHTRFEPSGFTGNPDIPMAKSIMDYLFRYMALKFLNRDERGNVGLLADQTDEYGDPTDMGNAPLLTVASQSRPETGSPGQAGPVGVPASSGEGRAFAAEKQVFVTQADAPPCPDCGSITTRNGACYRCANCGTSIGCS